MAEEVNEKPKKKRRLKNAETIREKAIKAQTESGKPKKLTQARTKAVNRAKHPFRFLIAPFRHRPLKWLAFVIAPPYLRNSWRELKLVTWPDRKQSRQLTSAVIIFAVIFGGLVYGVDAGLDHLFKEFILKQ